MVQFNTISELFLKVGEKHSDKVAFKYKQQQNWIDVTHKELFEFYSKLAFSLDELGLKKGDKVLLLSENRIEWIYSDAAFAHLGIISIPVFPTTSPDQLKYIINNSECTSIFVSNKFQLNKIESIKDEIENIDLIVTFDNCESNLSNHINFKQLFNERKETKEKLKEFIQSHSSKISPDDLLSIIYTSGTTGNPKGVMLTHKNMVANIKGALATNYFYNFKRSLSYLPLCHAYERMAGYYVMFSTSCTIALCDSIEYISSHFIEIKPELFTTVPELMDKIRAKILISVSKESESKQKIFNWAFQVGKDYVESKAKNESNIVKTLKYFIADKLVFSKVRLRMGGELSCLVSGGAAMNYDTGLFFSSLGINVLQGYGLTEASPCISINLPDSNELDTVGKPFNNVEVKINPDGEILCRGDNIMLGYYKDELATKQAIDEDNWLHTGDIGEITKLGNIKITDRKKNIFVTNSGKNIAPQVVESYISKSRFVSQVLLIGEARAYCTALIYPDTDQVLLLANKLRIKGEIDELLKNEKVYNFIKSDIDFYLKSLAKYEQIRKFAFLNKPLSVEANELSHKMSIKRHFVEEKYKDLIESMYK